MISQNRNRKDKRLWTDRKGGSKIVYFRGNDELEEADFITRSIKQYRSEDVDAMMAVLYRTNAQSRAIEDSLMRESIPYKIIGGVRFYERKEIKDALAYLKLIINPHDDVSLRRVINVPARGIGKGVMDSLQAIDPECRARRRAAAARRRPCRRSAPRDRCGPSWCTPSTRGSSASRAVGVAARLPRSDRRAGGRRAARSRSRSRSARCSIRPAT